MLGVGTYVFCILPILGIKYGQVVSNNDKTGVYAIYITLTGQGGGEIHFVSEIEVNEDRKTLETIKRNLEL